MNRGIWQAMVHRVAKSQTQMTQLSTHARTWPFPPSILLSSLLCPPPLYTIYSILTSQGDDSLVVFPFSSYLLFTWTFKLRWNM